ncbi:MAG: hypothetical protein EOO12_11580, partial [Chitinophagaceae bacterium]
MRKWLFFLLLLTGFCAQAQEPAWVQVPEMPSTEVYDLLQDHNGFLWVAHNAGISRYDGQRFVHYSNPKQNGRAVTDLCEDRQGRIWCHNFEGQILYVEHQQLRVLESYRFERESSFPRIVIQGDELVAGSSDGFFTCNTKTFQTSYHRLPGMANSLTALPGGVLLSVHRVGFYFYKTSGAVIPLHSPAIDTSGMKAFILQPEGNGDTAFLIGNPEGIVYRTWVRGDSLLAKAPDLVRARINAITVDQGEVWLHTTDYSRSSRGTLLQGENLSQVLRGRNGTVFYGSLRLGLMATYRQQAQLQILPFLQAGDFVRAALRGSNGEMLFSTEKRHLYVVPPNGRLLRDFPTDAALGPIQRLRELAPGVYLGLGGQGVYRLNTTRGTFDMLDAHLGAKDVTENDSLVVLSTTFGALKVHRHSLLTHGALDTTISNGILLYRRCRSVLFGTDGALYAALSHGLVRGFNGDTALVLFAGERLFATRLQQLGAYLLIGTFNQGLIIRNGTRMQRLGPPGGAYNAVIDIKKGKRCAWVLYDDVIRQVDADMNVREVTGLPFRGSEVTSLLESDSALLVTTTRGVFRVPLTGTAPVQLPTFIDEALANGKTLQSGAHLSRDNNSINIRIATPYFAAQAAMRYRYRLCAKATGCEWLPATEGQNSFIFVNLAPGSYTFSAQPVNSAGMALGAVINFSFIIDPPWWGTWWARLLMVALLTTLFFLLGLYGQRRRARRQRTRYEKMLAVEHERQRISAEIHDDLGATLSGVRLLAELAREKVPPGPLKVDLEKIHQSITSLTEKTREVIWTLNTEQDSVESLLLYIQKGAQHL